MPRSFSRTTDSAVDTTATFSQAGSYTLRLTAFDGELTSFEEVVVTVNPVANGGPYGRIASVVLADGTKIGGDGVRGRGAAPQ